MIHADPHPLAGKQAKVAEGPHRPFAGELVYVIDWFDRSHNNSWVLCAKAPAVVMYATRSQFKLFPLNDVVEVIINHALFLFHASELTTESNS